MNRLKLWPHLGVVVLVCAAIGGAVGLFLGKRQATQESAALPGAARIERVEGEVGLNRSLGDDVSDAQWMQVTPNTPISVGDRIYARDNSRTGIAFTGRNFARLEPNSSFDVLSLSPSSTQLALREGSAIFNIGGLERGGMFEVATPRGAFELQEPGLYEVGLNDDGSAWVSVLSGLAQVVGLAGRGEVNKGEMLSLLGQTAAEIALSRLSPDYAGNLVDEYYGYQYPDLYDGRYSDYNAYLSDPTYYDPYNRYSSYQYVDDTVPGVWNLDEYGDWQQVGNYGYAWRPRVEGNWSPYQQGSWMMDDSYGLTWVSDEPWGYAPYHYGRWANVDNQWFWIPDTVNTEPVYSPALVAFIPSNDANLLGWVPLAPGDQYAPSYYDANWQPHYLTQVTAAQRVINIDVPGALTVVSAEDFGRDINPKALRQVDKNSFAGNRVLDPLSVGELRQLALRTTNDRRRVDLPPGIAKKLETPVYTSARTFTPSRDARARRFPVEPVPENAKREKLKFKDEREAVAVRSGSPPKDEKRAKEKEALTVDAARGNREARRQVQEIRQQERAQQRAARQASVTAQRENTARPAIEKPAAAQSAQGERVGLGRKAEKEGSRPEANAARQNGRLQGPPPEAGKPKGGKPEGGKSGGGKGKGRG